jgi:glycosyltransferase involved in cell wall biosynthesis
MTNPTLFDAVIAIPAKNEEERIGACLKSLSHQTYCHPFGVVVVANNCTDLTADLARAYQTSQMTVKVVEVDLPPPKANAGQARRIALDFAAEIVKPNGILLTTDADAIADPDWLAEMMKSFSEGNDAVAGAVSADWDELSKFPEDVLAVGADEWEYQKLVAQVEALADPETHDPWPKHNQNCGANAGITAAFYQRIGGLPALPVGEDRAMFDAVRALDGKVRHSSKSHVTASARTIGRAAGGMADALRDRHEAEYLCDDLLEPVADLVRRAIWRHQCRSAWANGDLAEYLERIGLGNAPRTTDPGTPFGTIWNLVEQTHPKLQKQRLVPGDLDLQTRLAKRYLKHLQSRAVTTVFQHEDA